MQSHSCHSHGNPPADNCLESAEILKPMQWRSIKSVFDLSENNNLYGPLKECKNKRESWATNNLNIMSNSPCQSPHRSSDLQYVRTEEHEFLECAWHPSSLSHSSSTDTTHHHCQRQSSVSHCYSSQIQAKLSRMHVCIQHHCFSVFF